MLKILDAALLSSRQMESWEARENGTDLKKEAEEWDSLEMYLTNHLPFPLCSFFEFCLFFFSCLFLGLYLQHMEVLMVGVENQNCSCWPIPQPQQHGIWAMSESYTTAHGNTPSLTQLVRLGIKPKSSWILVGLVTAEPPWELPCLSFLSD